MPRADELVSAPLTHTAAPALPRLGRGQLGRALLSVVVFSYLGVVLLAPLAALLIESARLGLGALLAALWEREALQALGRTLLLTALAVVINGAFGVFAALALCRQRFVGRAVLSALSDLPLAVSPVMIGLGFVLLVGRQGALGPWLEQHDLKVVFAFPGLLLGTLFVTLPFTVREVAYVLDELGNAEEEAAVTLGASPAQAFMRVTLPNIRVGLGYGVLMTAARSLGEFGAVLVLGGSISGTTQTATTFIHDAVEARRLDAAYGMSLALGALSVGLLLIVEWKKHRRGGGTLGEVRVR